MTKQKLLAKAGLDLLSSGLAVVPVHNKAPIVKDWQRTKLAPDELTSWCQADHVTGVGIVSGAMSNNVVILDFDGKNGDWQQAVEHISHCLDLSASPQVRTGSGRQHIYVRCPDLPDLVTVKKFSRNGASVELRGNRSCTVAPPSRHPSGDFYRWMTDLAEPAEHSYSDLYDTLSAWGKLATDRPKQVSQLAVQTTWSDPDQFKHTPASAMKQRYKPNVQQLHLSRTYGRLPRRALEYLSISGPVQAGARNCELYWCSQQYCAAGYSLQDGLNLLVPPAIRSGLEPDEITNTIKSAYSAAAEFEPIGGY